MNRLFLLLFIFFSTLASAQENKIHFKNDYASNPYTAILFYHSENYVTIYAKGLNAEDLAVEKIFGWDTIQINAKVDTLRLSLFPTSGPLNGAPKNGKLKLINKKTKKVVREITFAAYTIKTEPVAGLGSIKSYSADRESILAQKGLVVTFQDDIVAVNKVMQIYSCTFFCQTPDMIYEIPMRGAPVLTDEIKDIIRKVPRNTTIKFIRPIAGCRRRLPDLEILVK